MSDFEPFDIWLETSAGEEIPLPGGLASIYGSLHFPRREGQAHVISNFVETMDGIVTLAEPGKEGGGDISGFNRYDRLVMGLLRASADAVLITSRSLEVNPDALWTAEDILPEMGDEFQVLRQAAGKLPTPVHVLVTISGEVNEAARVLRTPGLPVLVVTTTSGVERLSGPKNQGVHVRAAGEYGPLRARDILKVVEEQYHPRLVLMEAGPHMTAYFIEEQLLDELFLTISPQIAGREAVSKRLGFNAGKEFAPANPRWARLVSGRRAGDHLFLRYGFGERMTTDR
jgi:riboflavin biosynthesis pyrimidine reductase